MAIPVTLSRPVACVCHGGGLRASAVAIVALRRGHRGWRGLWRSPLSSSTCSADRGVPAGAVWRGCVCGGGGVGRRELAQAAEWISIWPGSRPWRSPEYSCSGWPKVNFFGRGRSRLPAFRCSWFGCHFAGLGFFFRFGRCLDRCGRRVSPLPRWPSPPWLRDRSRPDGSEPASARPGGCGLGGWGRATRDGGRVVRPRPREETAPGLVCRPVWVPDFSRRAISLDIHGGRCLGRWRSAQHVAAASGPHGGLLREERAEKHDPGRALPPSAA